MPSQDPQLKNLLDHICASPHREAQWLNLLAQLEFVGCRKIVKGLGFEEVDLSVLQHISEEASHAFLLKAQAARLGCRDQWHGSALGAFGWEYFQNLDHRVSALVQGTNKYALVSLAIERRVLELYPLYRDTTTNKGVRQVLSQILAQEVRHGEQFESRLFSDIIVEQATEIEMQLWESFLESVGTFFETPGPGAALGSTTAGRPPRSDLRNLPLPLIEKSGNVPPVFWGEVKQYPKRETCHFGPWVHNDSSKGVYDLSGVAPRSAQGVE